VTRFSDSGEHVLETVLRSFGRSPIELFLVHHNNSLVDYPVQLLIRLRNIPMIRRPPRRVWRLRDSLPSVIRSTVGPPDVAAFAERALDAVDLVVRVNFGIDVFVMPSVRDGAPRVHQLVNEPLASCIIERRVRCAPQGTANDDVAPVRRARCAGRIACFRGARVDVLRNQPASWRRAFAKSMIDCSRA